MAERTRTADGRRVRDVALLALVLIGCGALAFTHGSGDVGIWNSWVRAVEHLGTVEAFRSIWTDYPPGIFVLLGLGTRLGVSAGPEVKVLCAVGLAATAVVMFVWFREVAAVVVTIAALALNGLGLAALDLLFAPFLMGAFMLLQRRRYGWASLLFASACCVKWQPLVLAPVLLVFVLSEAWRAPRSQRARICGAAIVPGLALGAVVVAVFGARPMTHSLRRALDHLVLSGRALNVGWVVTATTRRAHWWHGRVRFVARSAAPGWVTPGMRGMTLLAFVVVIIALWRGGRTFEQALIASIAATLVYVTFSTGVHENHLFLAALLALPALWLVPTVRTELVLVIVLANVNLWVFYGPGVAYRWPRTIGRVDLSEPLAVVFVITMIVVVVRLLAVVAAPAPVPVTAPPLTSAGSPDPSG